MTNRPCVLAIDPGRAKCGVALVDQSGAVLHRSIEPTSSLASLVQRICSTHAPQAILIGNGTASQFVVESVRAEQPNVTIEVVAEEHTSELARARLLAAQKPKMWQRLIPRGLWAPAADYDDIVAVILCERWWAAHASPS